MVAPAFRWFSLLGTGAAFIAILIGCTSMRPEERSAAAAETEKIVPEEERVGRWGITIRSIELTSANPTGVGPAGSRLSLEPGEAVFIRSAVAAAERRYLYVTAGPDVSTGGWSEEADIAALPVYGTVRPDEGPVVLTESPRAEEGAAGLIRSETYLQIDDIWIDEDTPRDSGPERESISAAPAYHAVLDDGREGWLVLEDIASFDLFYARIVRLTEGFSFPLPGADRRTVESVHGSPDRRESEETPNIHHPEVIDRVYRFIYPGMTVRFYEAVSTGEEFVTSVTVTGGREILPFGIRIGMPKERLQRVLGEPHYRQDGRWVYTNTLYDRGEPPKSLVCTLGADTVTQITLTLE